MSVTREALDDIDSHWALKAVGPSRCKRARKLAERELARAALDGQFEFGKSSLTESNIHLLEQVALAYEVGSAEGLDALLRSVSTQPLDSSACQALAGAYRAFELLRVLPLHEDDIERAYQVLHVSSLAYCADRWTDARRWLTERAGAATPLALVKQRWDHRILAALFDAWVRLFRKQGWKDLRDIAVIITNLREDQLAFESDYLGQAPERAAPRALALMALYHWARATELLATYMLQGTPRTIDTELDQHYEAAREAALLAGDNRLDVLLRWLHVASRWMAVGSVWSVAHAVNSRVRQFFEHLTKTRELFEFLPPQRAAVQREGLLDPAHRAITVDLPTSGGKTMLAELRILQALNQFAQDDGWVAYIAPTRALVSQITRRLRRDLEPLDINVEQLSAGFDLDRFEEALLAEPKAGNSFHVLVATPEKMHMIIRNKRTKRPLVLAVMDEAHNIEDESRGLRIELLLATIKRDCSEAGFLLLMPNVPNADEIARWLGSGHAIHLGTSAWQPNQRVVGEFYAKPGEKKGDWRAVFKPLVTSHDTIELRQDALESRERPLRIPYHEAKKGKYITAAMAALFSERGTSIAVARKRDDAWDMAREIAKAFAPNDLFRRKFEKSEEVQLVQRYLADEIGPEFELIELLRQGIGLHHAGLSDEVRALMEWLVEEGHLAVLCATTTIAQGINFPVSSVVLSSLYMAGARRKMTAREFWNLAGRAGRIGHDSVGVVGIARGSDKQDVPRFVRDKTKALVSRLVVLLDEVQRQGELHQLERIIKEDDWADFRAYIAHLLNEAEQLDTLIAEMEQVLRNTLGYSQLESDGTKGGRGEQMRALLTATRHYAEKLAPGLSKLADSTGFSPEGVHQAIGALRDVKSLSIEQWSPELLFNRDLSRLPDLVGAMMHIPELRGALDKIKGSGKIHEQIANIAQDWVQGDSIREIAERYFSKNGKADVKSITNACDGIYKVLASFGTWGLSALSKLPGSGFSFDDLSDEQRENLRALPAMLYYGVRTPGAVLMRMNSVPRSIAERLAMDYEREVSGNMATQTVRQVRHYLSKLEERAWDRARPEKSRMTGSDYREIWLRLSGESI
jgi:replicative superfamily II helicase